MSRKPFGRVGRALAQGVLAETREELVRADSKASLLLAAAGVGIGAIVTAVLAGSWSPSELAPLGALLWWLGAASAALGIAALAYAVYPRTKRRGASVPPVLGYYADMARSTPDELQELISAAEKRPDERLQDQLLQVSKIVQLKYRGIRVALWALGAAAALCALSTLVRL